MYQFVRVGEGEFNIMIASNEAERRDKKTVGPASQQKIIFICLNICHFNVEDTK